jgi:hypothetical protein
MIPPCIVCVKVGMKYGPDYVNRLASMVSRQITWPYEFLCLTDDPAGLTCAYARIGTELPGWWAKLVLFQPHPSLIGKRVVYLDLDTVLVGPSDFLLDYEGDFAILRDFYRVAGYGSAVMSIAPGAGTKVWASFVPSRMAWYAGDQDWIQDVLPVADRWQDVAPGKIVSYKVHCQPSVPPDAAVVCFHGSPRPHEVDDPWMTEHWR